MKFSIPTGHLSLQVVYVEVVWLQALASQVLKEISKGSRVCPNRSQH